MKKTCKFIGIIAFLAVLGGGLIACGEPEPIDMFSMVSAGSSHSLAIKTDGTLWEWDSSISSPVQIGTESDWAFVSDGESHSLAIKTNGTLWAWGRNNDGQLGDGTEESELSPVKIGTESDWALVSAGGSHSLAIKTNGTLWAWGENFLGRLGDGTEVDKSSPVQIGKESNWASVSAGGSHSLAIKKKGSLWAWGVYRYRYNQYGHLVSSFSESPIQIGKESNWASVSAGAYHSFAIKKKGSLWAWGNSAGLFGDHPVQIGQ